MTLQRMYPLNDRYSHSLSLGEKRVLSRISFWVAPRELVAVMGPSGSGKSTLLNALAGMRRPDSGTVFVAGKNLYVNPLEFVGQIAYVPRGEIVHGTLTLGEAMRFAAELRIPSVARGSLSKTRQDRIRHELNSLHLSLLTKSRVNELSEGEHKRARIATELIADPLVLLLDEPTSNLDVISERQVMTRLRTMAERGGCVVVATHSINSLERLDTFDRVIMLNRRGQVAYNGPTSEVRSAFRCSTLDDVFAKLDAGDASDYTYQPLSSPYVAQIPQSPRRSALAQVATIANRELRTMQPTRSISFLLSLLVVPLAVGGLLWWVMTPDTLDTQAGTLKPGARTFLLMLLLATILLASVSALASIVKERTIFQRERMVGVTPAQYLAAKLAVFVPIVTIQSVILTYMGTLRQGGPDEWTALSTPPEVFISVWLIAVASLCIALSISAITSTVEEAQVLFGFLFIVELALCGALISLPSSAEWLMHLNPAYWGFASLASTVDLNTLYYDQNFDDPQWAHISVRWLLNIEVLAGIALVSALIGRAALHKWDPLRRGLPRYPALITSIVIIGLALGTSRLNEHIAAHQMHRGFVTSVAFSHNGLHVASAGKDGAIKIWDAHEHTLLVTLARDDGGVSIEVDSVAFLWMINASPPAMPMG